MADLFNVKTMSSLEIAELTGKAHSNVMRDIRNILEQLEDRRKFRFELSSRPQPMPNGGSKEAPCYILTKKDCLLLASGYDANLRAKIIDRWEELEVAKRNGGFQVPQSFAEALMLAARQQMQIEEQQKQIEQKEETIELQQQELTQSAPKVSYYDNHLQSVNALTTTQIAKEIGMSAEKLNNKLKELGIQFKQSGQWLLKSPYDKWGMHETRTNIFTSERGNTHTNTYTVWTQRGRRFIIALYENDWSVKKAIKQIKGELNPAA